MFAMLNVLGLLVVCTVALNVETYVENKAVPAVHDVLTEGWSKQCTIDDESNCNKYEHCQNERCVIDPQLLRNG
ncbi:hypothetical protein L596_017625 [Steinernema carpocapsae]|uniref:Uncharacterized protein n=1 Tax=Steinernema carpocapsae TaxID=34508 RepID=A0A4U5N278_STECR|nr:hypothetical protein L596_017625 [Steinernema carpocapsae]